jgi:RNA-directed DNA polymerase
MYDRVVQEMFRLVLDPAIESISDPLSFGFRKMRSAHQALGFIARVLHKTNKSYIYDADIENFFGTIDHA